MSEINRTDGRTGFLDGLPTPPPTIRLHCYAATQSGKQCTRTHMGTHGGRRCFQHVGHDIPFWTDADAQDAQDVQDVQDVQDADGRITSWNADGSFATEEWIFAESDRRTARRNAIEDADAQSASSVQDGLDADAHVQDARVQDVLDALDIWTADWNAQDASKDHAMHVQTYNWYVQDTSTEDAEDADAQSASAQSVHAEDASSAVLRARAESRYVHALTGRPGIRYDLEIDADGRAVPSVLESPDVLITCTDGSFYVPTLRGSHRTDWTASSTEDVQERTEEDWNALRARTIDNYALPIVCSKCGGSDYDHPEFPNVPYVPALDTFLQDGDPDVEDSWICADCFCAHGGEYYCTCEYHCNTPCTCDPEDADADAEDAEDAEDRGVSDFFQWPIPALRPVTEEEYARSAEDVARRNAKYRIPPICGGSDTPFADVLDAEDAEDTDVLDGLIRLYLETSDPALRARLRRRMHSGRERTDGYSASARSARRNGRITRTRASRRAVRNVLRSYDPLDADADALQDLAEYAYPPIRGGSDTPFADVQNAEEEDVHYTFLGKAWIPSGRAVLSDCSYCGGLVCGHSDVGRARTDLYLCGYTFNADVHCIDCTPDCMALEDAEDADGNPVGIVTHFDDLTYQCPNCTGLIPVSCGDCAEYLTDVQCEDACKCTFGCTCGQWDCTDCTYCIDADGNVRS